MSIRVLITAYCLTLFLVILGCAAIARSKHAGRGLWWLIGGLTSAFAGVLLFAGIPFLPVFFTIVLANEALLAAFVLLHQSLAAVLHSRRRYIGLGVLLITAQFFLYLHYTYVSPDLRARILVRSAAIAIEAGAGAFLLFRQRDAALLYPARVAGWIFAGFSALQASRLVTTIVWTPLPDRLHPDPVQAFYNCFNFMMGMGSCFAVVWLALCAQKQDLHVMATTDVLSGLMNRRAFDEVLERELQRSERRQTPVALLLIDLDHFKDINDRYGHPMGDEVIRRVSQLLCVNTRAVDAVARYGGEEFTMLLKGMRIDQAESIAERLRMQIEAMAGLPEAIRVTASIGIAMKDYGDTVTSLLKRSDEALYASKRAGRNRVSTEYAYSECEPVIYT